MNKFLSLTVVLLTFSLVATDCHAQRGRRGGDSQRRPGRDSGDRSRFGRSRGESGAGGSSRSFNPMSRMDSDGDGRISQQEFDKIPESFRSRLSQMGIKPGLSVEDFGQQMREGFTRMREEREREIRDDSGNEQTKKDSRANRNLTNRAPFRPRKRERVTVDLPPKYSEIDADFDGQLGLYEWLTSKRDSLELFDEMDIDQDGLLTPIELKFYDEVLASGSEKQATPPTRERLVIIGPGGQRISLGAGGESNVPVVRKLTDSEREEETGKSRYYFTRMDKNKDGVLQVEEFDQGRLVPWFKKTGIAVQPMSQEEFSKAYVSAVERTEKDPRSERGGRDRGGRDRGGRGEGGRGERRGG